MTDFRPRRLVVSQDTSHIIILHQCVDRGASLCKSNMSRERFSAVFRLFFYIPTHSKSRYMPWDRTRDLRLGSLEVLPLGYQLRDASKTVPNYQYHKNTSQTNKQPCRNRSVSQRTIHSETQIKRVTSYHYSQYLILRRMPLTAGNFYRYVITITVSWYQEAASGMDIV